MLSRIYKYFRYDADKYDTFLDDPSNFLGDIITRFIMFLVLLFIVVFTIESIGDLQYTYRTQFLIFDAFISSVFAIEYSYRFAKSKQKFLFLVQPIRIIDLLSFLPFFLGLFTVGDYLKILRILKILKILRFVKKMPLTSSFVRSLKDYIDEYKTVSILFLVVLCIGSFLVYYVEKDIVDTHFTSVPVALWWGLVTMTTVGYGDVYPITGIGRLCGSMLVILGPLLLALISAVTIMVFVETAENEKSLSRHKRVKQCVRCQTRNIKTANYCVKCGKKFIAQKEKGQDFDTPW